MVFLFSYGRIVYNRHVQTRQRIHIMKRLRVLSLLPALLLASCSKVDYAGVYEFRLGKTDGSHLAVTATLTNEDYIVEGSKKMSITADLGAEMSPTAIIEQYGEEYPLLEPFIDIITDEVAGIKEIPLYYSVLNQKDAKRGYKLSLGSDFAAQKVAELKEKYPIVKELLDLFHIEDTRFRLEPETVRYYVGAYVDSKTLTFEMPVSMEDLEMQKFWYGKSNRISDDYVDKLPGEKGDLRFGTHPKVTTNAQGIITASEVKQVNRDFEKEFSNTPIVDGDDNKIAVLVQDEVEGKKVLRCHLTSTDPEITYPHSIEGFVYTKDMVGEFEHKQAIKFKVSADGSAVVAYNDKTGRDEGFIDDNDTEFRFADTIQAPYEFRDFHTVNVGLTKI